MVIHWITSQYMIKGILVNILFASQVSQCTCDVYKYPYSSPFDNSCNMLLFIHFIKSFNPILPWYT